MKPFAPVLFAALVLLPGAGCLHVKTDPVEVHMTVDVNVKIDRALDDFFGDIDRRSATIETPAAK